MAAAVTGHLAVGFSGGRDSTALLHATCAAARGTGLVVHALHVHHGLSPHADAWLRHCRAQCRRWARAGAPLVFHAARVDVAAAPGDSIEAQARTARYAALARLARDAGCGLVLLAHHAEDQAETVLLQALRGAGPRGLAAMPALSPRAGLVWARPWLRQPRRAIDAYLARHRLSHVEDDSNAHLRHARNRLRHQVWPALRQAFPDAAGALADVALQAQDAAALLDHLAQADLAPLQRDEDGRPGLDLAGWQALAPPRRRNALQAWLRGARDAPPTRAWLLRLDRELSPNGSRRWLLPDGQLQAYRGVLRWQADAAAAAPPAAAAAATVALAIDAPGRYAVPAWRGTLVVSPAAAGGVPLAALATVHLRPRQPQDRYQRAPGTVPRSLKKAYQAAGVPAWGRGGPLVCDAQGRLLHASGLGADARATAWPGEPRVNLHWQPDADAPLA